MKKIAAQLFTLREHLTNKSDFHRSLHQLAAAGFEYVEFAAVGAVDGENADTTAAEARAMLDDHGIKAFGAHRRWGDLRDRTGQEIEYLTTLGCQMVATPIIFDQYDYTEFDGYRRFLDDAVEIRAKLAAAELDFCFHNHSHEFVYFAGTSGMEYLIENSDLFIELDVYWTSVTGADPVPLIDRLGNRCRYLHCKDAQVFPPDDAGEWTMPGPTFAPVGEGLLNWTAILAAARRAGTEYYVIEQDRCLRDPFDCLSSSRQFLLANA